MELADADVREELGLKIADRAPVRRSSVKLEIKAVRNKFLSRNKDSHMLAQPQRGTESALSICTTMTFGVFMSKYYKGLNEVHEAFYGLQP